MEPIDRRVTAAQLMALRDTPDGDQTIAWVLQVRQMDPLDAIQTRREIEAFLKSGDATVAAQLIHDANVRQRPARKRLRS